MAVGPPSSAEFRRAERIFGAFDGRPRSSPVYLGLRHRFSQSLPIRQQWITDRWGSIPAKSIIKATKKWREKILTHTHTLVSHLGRMNTPSIISAATSYSPELAPLLFLCLDARAREL